MVEMFLIQKYCEFFFTIVLKFAYEIQAAEVLTKTFLERLKTS